MKILIIKIGALGDVIMALPMLEAIQSKWPGAKVTWVCGRSVESLLRSIDGIDRLIVLDDRKLLKGGVWGALTTLIPLWLKLLGKSFDLIVTGHSDKRYDWLSLTTLSSARRSFYNDHRGRWPIPGLYHADEYVRLITETKGRDGARIPRLKPQLPQRIEVQCSREQKIISIAPGGAKNILRDDRLRRWPLESYAKLTEKLLKEGYQVFITGSKEDSWVQKSFENMAVVDLVGQTNILDLIALYGRSDLVITHDSGPLHLAIASGQPVLALFGPTIPLEKVPREERVSVLWGGESLACRPCYDGKNYAVCSENLCLQGVSVDEVFKEANRLVSGR